MNEVDIPVGALMLTYLCVAILCVLSLMLAGNRR